MLRDNAPMAFFLGGMLGGVLVSRGFAFFNGHRSSPSRVVDPTALITPKVIHDIRVMPDGSIRITTVYDSAVPDHSVVVGGGRTTDHHHPGSPDGSTCSFEKIDALIDSVAVGPDLEETKSIVVPNTPPTTPRTKTEGTPIAGCCVEVDYETDYDYD